MPWRKMIVWSIAGLLIFGVATGLLRAMWLHTQDRTIVVDTDDPAVRQYLQNTQHVRPLSAALRTLDELMNAPQMGNDAWTVQVANQIATIQNAHMQLAALEHDPPQSLQAFHTSLLRATARCNDMTLILSNGIDNHAMNDIERTRTLMEQCNRKFHETIARVIIPLSAEQLIPHHQMKKMLSQRYTLLMEFTSKS